jgi:hypothetical protein
VSLLVRTDLFESLEQPRWCAAGLCAVSAHRRDPLAKSDPLAVTIRRGTLSSTLHACLVPPLRRSRRVWPPMGQTARHRARMVTRNCHRDPRRRDRGSWRRMRTGLSPNLRLSRAYQGFRWLRAQSQGLERVDRVKGEEVLEGSFPKRYLALFIHEGEMVISLSLFVPWK